MKKILSILIASSVLAGLTTGLGALAESNEIVYIEENFESSDKEAVMSGWNADKREGDYDVVYDEEEENSYLASWGESLSDYQKFPQLVKYFPKAVDRGILKVSFRAKASNPKGNCMIEIDNDVLWPALQIVFRSAGTLTFNEYVIVEKFEVNRWYNIEAYIDLDRLVYDAYLDGEIVVKSGAFKNEGVIDLTAFKTTGYFIDDEYAQLGIDDIRITDYTKQKETEESEEKPYNETLEMMSALGVIDERGAIEFDGDKSLTRAEFLRYLVGMSDVEESQLTEAETELFKDVPVENEYARLVNWAYNRGIIMMNSERLFNPDMPIKSIDAIVMLVRMAGYSPKVSSEGGYIKGYLKVANEIELIKPSFNTSGTLTGNMMLELFKAALDVDVMQLVIEGEFNYKVNPGDTMAKVYKKLEKIEGVVTANSKTGIVNATGAKSGSLEIDKVSYPCSDIIYDKYLGYYVEAYIDTDNDDSIVYVTANNRNTTTVLAKKDYRDIYIDGNHIMYTNDKEKEIKLKINSPYVIYNDRAYSMELDDDLININNGTLTFISNDRDDIYDVILINEAEHILFSSADVINEIIYGTAGEKYILGSDYRVFRDNEEISISQLKYGDVVSIRRTISNSEEGYEITSFRNIKYGTIKAIKEDEIKIDDTFYQLSEEYEKYSIIPKIGFSGAFYLDCDGNILYFEEDSVVVSGKKTGYILSGAYAEDEDTYYLSFANFAGGHERKALIESVRINGKKTVANVVDDILLATGENSTISQVFDYWENDEGLITRIVTDEYECAFADANRYLYNSGKLLYRNEEKTAFIGKNTIVYQIPTEDLSNYEKYGRFTTTGYNEGTEIKVSAYNLDEINVAEIVLIKESVKSFTVNDTRIMITNVSRVLNGNDTEVNQIGALLNGKPVTYMVSEHETLPELPYGTVMTVNVNNRNEIVSYELRTDLKNFQSQTMSGAYSDTQYCYGKIKSANNEGCIIDVNGTEYPYIYNTNFKAYLVDTGSKTCNEISTSAIGAYRNAYSDAYVYTVGYRGGMREMYIYVR